MFVKYFILQVPLIASNLTYPNGARVALYGPQTNLSEAQKQHPGATEYIQCNTVDLIALLRVQVFNSTRAEMFRANAVQKKYEIAPLSPASDAFTATNKIKADLKSQGLTTQDIAGLRPTQCNQNEATALKCWKIIGLAMKSWPIQTPEAIAYTAPFSQIGLSQTSGFNPLSDPNVQAALGVSNLPDVGLTTNPKVSKLVTTLSTKWKVKTAFSRSYNLTSDDLLLRATIGALLFNPPEQATYYTLNVDFTGKPLQGGFTYSLKFQKGHLPPVNAFWSVTAYDAVTGSFVAHSLEHSIYSSEGLSQAEDGSVEIVFSSAQPRNLQKGQNWLQITTTGTDFLLILRAYLPQASVLDLSYVPPAVFKL